MRREEKANSGIFVERVKLVVEEGVLLCRESETFLFKKVRQFGS